MKKEDYYGKYILRHGDLKPEEVNESLCKYYRITIRFLEYLKKANLLFDNREDAIRASGNAESLIRAIQKRQIVSESDLAYVGEEKKRIYISGPISGYDIEERRDKFKRVQMFLEAQGYEVVNPLENGLPAEATTHQHMKRDIELLMTCDSIYMMRFWTHSKGCKVEFDVATSIGMPVYFEQTKEFIKFV